MAEADSFIFTALQQYGWLENSSEITSWTVADLSSDAFIVLVLKLLTQFQEENDSTTFTIPSSNATVPVGVAARHRVASKLANILKEQGYAGDCGYNNFLYPCEKETRNILSWLVGKLPRSKSETTEDEEDNKIQNLNGEGVLEDTSGRKHLLDCEQLSNIFSSWKKEKTLHMLPNRNIKELKGFQRLPLQTLPLKLPWTKPTKSTQMLFEGFPNNFVKLTSLLEALAVSKRDSTIPFWEEQFDDHRANTNHEEIDSLCKTDSTFHKAAMKDEELIVIRPDSFQASALPGALISLQNSSFEAGSVRMVGEGSSLEMAKSSNIDKIKEGPKTSSAQGERNEEQSLDSLQKQLKNTERRIAAMQKVLNRERHQLHEVEQHIIKTQQKGLELQKRLAIEKQLVSMLPEAQANIEKLESICARKTEKKKEIVQQMKAACKPLLKEYKELKSQNSGRQTRRRQLIREIKDFRTEMQEIASVIRSKTECMRTLELSRERQLAKLGKKKDMNGGTITRNMYTSRIMDIIKQVHKQKQDITKILNDITGIQRQLNTASEKLKRTEAVTDDKLYKAACKSKSTGSTKSQSYIECYRKFVGVRELFDELIILIGEVGKKENAVRDLHNWISQLQARGSSNHLDKVLADLETIREENATLQNELHAGVV
ncbi:hypothetical protein PsorP6_011744 [Peronosclerospora sorghi]|uniref:Uncharacterized protein n=1 Tax=Peronosclerospora sorghi TaxID=230839 RepID=A0ACC0WI03_9STRA|nr:hypothetical protein PsorP6_011744 [Peronosclerospora sorghi]